MSKQATAHAAEAGQREARHWWQGKRATSHAKERSAPEAGGRSTPEAGHHRTRGSAHEAAHRSAGAAVAARSAEPDAIEAGHGSVGKARHRPVEKRVLTRMTEPGAPEVRYRPMYARALRLRHLHPGGMLCFVYFEGAIALGLLLALAELVSWWVVLILPVSVALMVKVNDLVAGAVARSAARTPERERERLRREVIAFMPTAGHPTISPGRSQAAADTEQSGAVTALTEATVQLPVAARQDRDVETTAQLPAVPRAAEQDAQDTDPPEAGRRDAAGGGYAAAGRYLDAAWRQHAYAMAHHVEPTDATSQRERQSASRRYE